MLRKRWLLPLILIVLAVVVSAFYFSSSSNPVVSKTAFTNVNRNNLLWSGQTEGETVNRQTESSGSVRGMNYPPFNRYSLLTGLEEAAKELGGMPLIPSLLPDGMICSDVYIGPVVDICFSYNKTEDPSFADIVIEISRPYIIPTLEEQKHAVSSLTGVRMVQAGDIWVSISDKYYNDPGTGASWAEGYFFHDSFYYAMSVKYPLTNQDLTTIIGSMKTPT